MPGSEEWSLSLAEWLVLCVMCEQPTHGFAVARILDHDGSLGQIWRVPKPVVYRAMQRLELLELVAAAGEQASSQGPVRILVDATPAGRQAASAWLTRPVSHTREVRSELLAKLALLHRAGADPQPLLEAQREQLKPIAAALREHLAATSGFDRTLVLWRYETVTATLRFLDAVRLQGAG
jgi:PadR family transcriptional regulator AphA